MPIVCFLDWIFPGDEDRMERREKKKNVGDVELAEKTEESRPLL